jgi:nucleoside-triphosphatase THEP1
LALSRIVALTGELGSGKTTACGRLVTLARSRGLAVAGILSPARLAGGRKVGIDLVNIRSGERRPLGDGRSGDDLQIATGRGPLTRGWRFSGEVLEWGSGILRSILDDATPWDLLVIDEIGPLELERWEGWLVALEVLRSGGYRLAVPVVRPALLERLIEGIQDAPALDLQTYVLTGANRDRAAAEILALPPPGG